MDTQELMRLAPTLQGAVFSLPKEDINFNAAANDITQQYGNEDTGRNRC